MEKQVKIAILLVGLILIIAFPIFADQPPDPGGDPTGEPVGGAPIGGGLLMMILAGAIYGVRKIRMAIKK